MESGEAYTPQQWLEKFGHGKRFRYTNVRYVRMMCRRQMVNSGGHQYRLSLPEGWQAKQIGRDWYIYPAAPGERSRADDSDHEGRAGEE